MPQPQTFTLAELKQLLDGHNEHLANNYISQNLVVARHVVPQVVSDRLAEGPFLMPEMRVLVVKSGGSDVVLNLQPRHLEKGMLLFLAENSVVEFQHIMPETSGFGLSLSHDLFSLALATMYRRRSTDGCVISSCAWNRTRSMCSTVSTNSSTMSRQDLITARRSRCTSSAVFCARWIIYGAAPNR